MVAMALTVGMVGTEKTALRGRMGWMAVMDEGEKMVQSHLSG